MEIEYWKVLAREDEETGSGSRVIEWIVRGLKDVKTILARGWNIKKMPADENLARAKEDWGRWIEHLLRLTSVNTRP